MQIEETIKACIHCGICLPACPTYQVTANEGHSPRGRLYLINDAIKGGDINEQSIDYLDSCLECSACETVCPSGVDYINILDYARTELVLSHYAKGFMASIRRFVFEFFLPNRSLMNLFRVVARFLPLRFFNKLSPKFDFKYKPIQTDHYYRCGQDGAKVLSLPLGCVMDTVYNNVHWDTIRALNAIAYDVYIPETQCCGALAYHSGEVELGRQQAAATISSLSRKAYPVVMNSAGCGAWLKNHTEFEVVDLIEVLEPALQELPCDDLNLKAVYHPACHLNHQQGVSDQYLNLLEKIPGLELIPLYEADLCCGSAGFYNLIQAEMAEKIGQRKAENIRNSLMDQTEPIVLTANPGCMSQIAAQLGDDYQVLHPVSLIASLAGCFQTKV